MRTGFTLGALQVGLLWQTGFSSPVHSCLCHYLVGSPSPPPVVEGRAGLRCATSFSRQVGSSRSWAHSLPRRHGSVKMKRGRHAPFLTKEFWDSAPSRPRKPQVYTREPREGPVTNMEWSEMPCSCPGCTDGTLVLLVKPMMFGPYLRCSCGLPAKSRKISFDGPGPASDNAHHKYGHGGCATEFRWLHP